jgi:4-hydroxy-tetrahydrodipicolinate synthase
MEPRVTTIKPDTTGVFVIAPTPFEDSGQICWTSTGRLVDFYRGAGAHGITILGMMGEAAKLDAQESLDFARHVIERAGSLPVIVGVSAPGFAAMRTLARAVVDFLLVRVVRRDTIIRLHAIEPSHIPYSMSPTCST